MNTFPLSAAIMLSQRLAPEERRVAFVQRPGDLMCAPMVEDAGALPGDRVALGKAGRVWALPGPGATLRGLAMVLQEELLNRLPNWRPKTEGELPALGAVLFRLGRHIDTGASEPLSKAAASAYWLVGTLFPLPVWQNAGNSVQVAGEALRDAFNDVSTFSLATAGEWLAATTGARELEQVDPFYLKQKVSGADLLEHGFHEHVRLHDEAAAAATDATAEELGLKWGAQARWNPYAALFPVLEFVDCYRKTEQSLVVAFTKGFFEALTTSEIGAVASTSAGYAIFRALWRTSGPDLDVADALGVDMVNADLTISYPKYPGSLEPPVAGGPRGGITPPLPTPASRNNAPAPIMGFGRRVPFRVVSYPLNDPQYHGISYLGDVPVLPTLEPGLATTVSVQTVFPVGTQDAWARVTAAASRTEGNLDATSSWDSGTLSLGFQQWSMPFPTEGPGLLARLKNLAPTVFDAVVRSSEIDASYSATLEGDTGVTAKQCMESCQLWRLHTDGGTPTELKATKKSRRPILEGFGWIQHPNQQWSVGQQAAWISARWAVAARYVPAIWQAQAEMAYGRIPYLRRQIEAWTPEALGLDKINDVPRVPTGTGGRLPTVLEIFVSEAAVTSLIDHHINRTGDVPAAIVASVQRAVNGVRKARTLANPQAPSTDPIPLDDEFRLRVFVAHQGYRTLIPAADKTYSIEKPAILDVAPMRITKLAVGAWDNDVSITFPFPWPPLPWPPP